MTDTIYVDQLTNISLYGGVVRLEFSVIDTVPKETMKNRPNIGYLTIWLCPLMLL